MNRRTAIKVAAAGLAPLRSGRGAPPQDPLSWEAMIKQDWAPPKKLAAFRSVRPRLFLTAARIDELKRRISGTHRDTWEAVQENADRHLSASPPERYNSEGEMRKAGRGIPWQALAFLLTGDRRYLEGAKSWILKICDFPRWEDNASLAGGECLFGVAVGYDWLYHALNDQHKKRIREKLVRQAQAMRNGPPVHHDVWLANHNHVEHIGLAAAGFALYDEVPEAIDWIRQADLVFRTMFRPASDDGSSTEGHQYWAYSTEAILRFTELARDLLDENLYGPAWLKSVPSFVIHSMLPGFDARNHVMSFGDSHRTFSSHGPAHILYRLAAEYRNPHAQWLAREMQKRRVGRNDYCTWTNLLWYDDKLASAPLTELPTFWHATDIGWITSRSGWDDQALMIGFKCGPMHGHKVQPYYESQVEQRWPKYHVIGGGHGHPDVNSFQIFARGKWLAIDPQYERPKWTRNHNTILVDGQGQLGEGQTWFDRAAVMAAKASSAMVKAQNGRELDYLVGDAGNIYPALGRFHRHLLYAKPDWIVIADDLEAKAPATFEWVLHFEGRMDQLGKSHWAVKNEPVAMDLVFLTPLTVRIEGACLRASTERSRSCLILVALHPRGSNEPAGVAELSLPAGRRVEVTLRSGNRRLLVDLDIAARRAELRAPAAG
jgi:hypothetical protein